MSIKKKLRRERRRKFGLTLFLIIALAIGIAIIMVWKVFVVKEVEVVGNEIYADETIENWALDDEYSWNSIYVVLKHKFTKAEEIPFVDSMEIKMVSPQKLEITVIEKGILGYVYVPSVNQYAYFDKDGYVVELSNEVIDGVTKITGLSVENAVLYEKLDFNNATILRTLLNVTQVLKKYDRVPNNIYISGIQIYMDYGTIQVNLGGGTSVNEKILRMDQILKELVGENGMLHLETWTEDNTDIYFKKGEHITIPGDLNYQMEDQKPYVDKRTHGKKRASIEKSANNENDLEDESNLEDEDDIDRDESDNSDEIDAFRDIEDEEDEEE